jgi:hypothetical protein
VRDKDGNHLDKFGRSYNSIKPTNPYKDPMVEDSDADNLVPPTPKKQIETQIGYELDPATGQPLGQ